MNHEIKIESGIEMPPPKGIGCIAAMRRLDIGQSFVYPLTKKSSLSATATRVGIKVATRQISPTEVRVWRIA